MEIDNFGSSQDELEVIAAWCHQCTSYVNAERNRETREMECIQCRSNFVECGGQNVESFLSPTNESTIRNETSESANGNELVQQILNRVLGLGIQVRPHSQSTLLNVMQQAAADSGRPIGIVIRQAVSPEELDSISTMLSTGTRRTGVIPSNPDTIPDRGSRFSGSGLSQINSQPMVGGLGGLASILAGLDPLGVRLGGNGLSHPDRSFEELLHHILMNENSHAGAPPATATTIESLTREVISSDTDLQGLGDCCSITQEAFEIGDVAVKLPCGHAYKQESIVQWLRMHDTCPVCRVRLPSTATATIGNQQLP